MSYTEQALVIHCHGDSLAGIASVPDAPRGVADRLEWLEVSSREDMALLPASIEATQTWRDAGWQVGTHVAKGPAFWQTTEIETAPDLLPVTIDAIDRATAGNCADVAVRGLASTC